MRTIRKYRTELAKILNEIIYENYTEKLGGDNIIVEIDETKFVKRKYNRGHKVDSFWILGIVEGRKLKELDYLK